MQPIRIVDQDNMKETLDRYNDHDLLKLLLRIECIQSDLIHLLFQAIVNKFTLIDQSTQSSNQNRYKINENLRYSALNIFNRIRWCDVIYEPLIVIDTLITSVMPILNDESFKIEVVSTLPSICPDSRHSNLAENLIEFLTVDPSLIPCIFDTISNLNLSKSSDAMLKAVELAKELLITSDDTDLPIIVRFLLDTVSDKDSAMEVINQLREKLLEYLNSSSHHDDAFLSSVTVIFGILKSSFQNDLLFITLQHIFDLHTIENKQMNAIDLWIIFSLYSIRKLRYKLNTILVRKFVAGLLNFSILSSSITTFMRMLDNEFFSLINIAQSLISLPIMQSRLMSAKKSPSQLSYILSKQKVIFSHYIKLEHAHLLACEFYFLLYCEFTTASHRQEIVASLIAHISSPNIHECNASLYVLKMLSECEHFTLLRELPNHSIISTSNHLNLMKTQYSSHVDIIDVVVLQLSSQSHNSDIFLHSFNSFIFTLLQDIQKFSYCQVKSIFRIIFLTSMTVTTINRLCQSLNMESTESLSLSDYLPDEIMIYLKKYLNSYDKKYKKIAILGFLACLSALPYSQSDSSHSIGKIIGENILENLLFGINDDSEIQMFTFNELSKSVDSKFIQDHLLSKLLEFSETELQKMIGFSKTELLNSESHWQKLIQYNCSSGVSSNILTRYQNRKRSDLMCGLLITVSSSNGILSLSGSSQNHNRLSLTCPSQHLPSNPEENEIISSNEDEIVYVKILSGVIQSLQANNRRLPSLSSSSSSSSSHSVLIHDEKQLFDVGNLRCNFTTNITSCLLLLSSCHRAVYRSMDEIGSLLFSTLELPAFHLITCIEGFNIVIQDVICNSLVHAVDWMRQVLNSFTTGFIPTSIASQRSLGPSQSALSVAERISHDEACNINSRGTKDDNLIDINDICDVDKGRLILRLNTLIDLESQLLALLQRCPESFKHITKYDLLTHRTTSKRSLPSKAGAVGVKLSQKSEKAAKVGKAAKFSNNLTKGIEKKKSKKKLDDNDDLTDLFDMVERDEELPTTSTQKTNIASETANSIDFTNSFSIDEIEYSIESILKPMNSSIAMMLGFGVNEYPFLFPNDRISSVINVPTMTQSSMHQSTHIGLTAKSTLRLLQHLLSCLRSYKKSSSYSMNVSNFQSINDLESQNFMVPITSLLSPSPSEALNYYSNIHLHTADELNYYQNLEKFHVFFGLSYHINEFLTFLRKNHPNVHTEDFKVSKELDLIIDTDLSIISRRQSVGMNGAMDFNDITVNLGDSQENQSILPDVGKKMENCEAAVATVDDDCTSKHHSVTKISGSCTNRPVSDDPEAFLANITLVLYTVETTLDSKVK